MMPLIPGNLVTRAKGLVTHFGVIVGPDCVLHIVPNGTPRTVSLAEFAQGHVVTQTAVRDAERAGILDRAYAIANTPWRYDLIGFNCEHVKNYVLTGKPYSETVQAAAIACVTIGLAGLALRAAR